MNAREANLIAKRYQARKQAFDDLHALLLPFFRRTYLADSMKEISECVSEALHANTLCGWLSDYGDFDELDALIGEIRRDGGRKRFTSLNDIPAPAGALRRDRRGLYRIRQRNARRVPRGL